MRRDPSGFTPEGRVAGNDGGELVKLAEDVLVGLDRVGLGGVVPADGLGGGGGRAGGWV